MTARADHLNPEDKAETPGPVDRGQLADRLEEIAIRLRGLRRLPEGHGFAYEQLGCSEALGAAADLRHAARLLEER